MMAPRRRGRRVIRALLLATTIIATPTLAQADPATLLTLAFTAAGAAVSGGAIAGLSATLAAVLGAAIALGGKLLTQALFSPNLDTGAQRENRSRDFDPHPPFRFAFGEFPLGGSVVFHYATGNRYYVAYLINSIPSLSLDRIEINDGIKLNIVSDASNDINDMSKGAKSDTNPWDEDGDNAITRFWFGDGTHTQAPQEWLDQIPDIVQSTDIWKGATIVFVTFYHGGFNQHQARWGHGSPPPLKFFGKWSKLYDPRKDPASGVTGASGSHDPDDSTTWEYSANPALAALALVRDSKALGFDDEMIPIQQYADAADACEVEDGGVSEATLHSEDWSTLPTSQAVGTDAGSGVWTFNRGTVELGTGTIGGFSGEPVLKLFSEDTDGTLANSELGRAGVYIDMEENSRRDDIEYLLASTIDIGGEVGVDKYRVTVYQANKGGTASSADQESTFMPPDATGITTLYDTGYDTIGSGDPAEFSDLSFEGDYVSLVIEGGGPNEDNVEVGGGDITTISQGGKQRFRCDGLIVINEREISLLDPVLASMAGHLDTTDGLLGIRAGVWVAPTDTLSQPIGDDIEVRGTRDAGFDTVRAKFIGRHREWEETDGPGYALRSGARVHPLQLGMVREPEQAARLEKIFGKRAEPNRIISATWDGREINRRLGERVNASLPGFGRAEGTFVIESKTPVTQEVDNGEFEVATQMTLVEDVEATYNWASADYTEAEASTPPAQVSPDIDAPTSVTAAQSNYRSAGGAVARLEITVTVSTEVAEDADWIRVEVNDGSGYVHLITVEAATSTTQYVVYLNTVAVGLSYTARARAEADALGVSDWVVSGSVTIVTPALDFDSADFSAEYS